MAKKVGLLHAFVPLHPEGWVLLTGGVVAAWNVGRASMHTQLGCHLLPCHLSRPQNIRIAALRPYKVHEPRKERESRFVGTVSKTVKKGGRCLIPVFALGRAQELLLILDEYWQARGCSRLL